MKKLLFILLFLCSCSINRIPERFLVRNFDIERYMGTWFEVARTDNKYQKDLVNSQATYTLMPNGRVKVENSGYNTKTNEYQKKEGEAYLVQQGIGQLRITFKKPFYSYYNIVLLDKNYKYAVVSGGDFETIWILARTTKLSKELLKEIDYKLFNMGFDVRKLFPRREAIKQNTNTENNLDKDRIIIEEVSEEEAKTGKDVLENN